MHINWKKTIIIALDLVLGTYLVFAFTRFNKPDETKLVCTKVNINIQDEMTNGFLNAKEIKKRLEARKLYPLGEPLKEVNARMIEETHVDSENPCLYLPSRLTSRVRKNCSRALPSNRWRRNGRHILSSTWI